MTPICVNCKLTMKCEKNDVLIADDIASQATYWRGDMFSCQCGNKVMVGFSKAFTKSDADFDEVPELVFKWH